MKLKSPTQAKMDRFDTALATYLPIIGKIELRHHAPQNA
jgi:hypothetical protein